MNKSTAINIALWLLMIGVLWLGINQLMQARKIKVLESRIEETRGLSLEEARRIVEYIKDCEKTIYFHEKDINFLQWKTMDKTQLNEAIMTYSTNCAVTATSYVERIGGIAYDMSETNALSGTYNGKKFINGIMVEGEE